MGLFDKKFCDICGNKIGLLGNRKLEDGNMCKDCAGLLSPFFSDRRSSTVDEIKQQLAYREQNRQNLNSFNADRVFGEDTKFYIDSARGCFIVSRYSRNDWDRRNPDIIPLSAVAGCNFKLEENREEEYYENSEGESVSYNPPRFTVTYDFVLEFTVNHQFFDEFTVTLNDSEILEASEEFAKYYQLAMNILNTVAPGKFTAPNINMGYNAYNQPQGNFYGQPQGNPYSQPQMNPYGQPQGNPYSQPQANPYAQPQANPYAQPQVNPYAQPQVNPYSQPQVNPYAQPQANPYGQPQANPYSQPQANPFSQPQSPAASAWICPNCNAQNTGNFCCSCGAQKR